MHVSFSFLGVGRGVGCLVHFGLCFDSVTEKFLSRCTAELQKFDILINVSCSSFSLEYSFIEIKFQPVLSKVCVPNLNSKYRTFRLLLMRCNVSQRHVMMLCSENILFVLCVCTGLKLSILGQNKKKCTRILIVESVECLKTTCLTIIIQFNTYTFCFELSYTISSFN